MKATEGREWKKSLLYSSKNRQILTSKAVVHYPHFHQSFRHLLPSANPPSPFVLDRRNRSALEAEMPRLKSTYANTTIYDAIQNGTFPLSNETNQWRHWPRSVDRSRTAAKAHIQWSPFELQQLQARWSLTTRGPKPSTEDNYQGSQSNESVKRVAKSRVKWHALSQQMAHGHVRRYRSRQSVWPPSTSLACGLQDSSKREKTQMPIQCQYSALAFPTELTRCWYFNINLLTCKKTLLALKLNVKWDSALGYVRSRVRRRRPIVGSP